MISNVERSDLTSLIKFKQPMMVASWAPHNGGLKRGITAIINQTLPREKMLPNNEQVAEFLEQNIIINALDADKTVGLLTTVTQKFLGFHVNQIPETGLLISAFATVGLHNARSPLDPGTWCEEKGNLPPPPGTINIIVVLNRKLTEKSALELLQSLTLGKAHFMLRQNIISEKWSAPCLATGTDCIAVCSPLEHEIKLDFAGLHTALAYEANAAAMKVMELSLSLRRTSMNQTQRGKDPRA